MVLIELEWHEEIELIIYRQIHPTKNSIGKLESVIGGMYCQELQYIRAILFVNTVKAMANQTGLELECLYASLILMSSNVERV